MKSVLACRDKFPFFVLAFLLLIAVSSARAEWTLVGPFGGDVRSLTADPQEPDRLYLGTRTGQIFVSQDAGRSWNRLITMNAPPDWVVDSLVIDPSNPAILYAGMWSVNAEAGGIYKSTDGGASWKELDAMRGESIRALVMAPSSSKTLVAGSLQGVFRSDDEGATWRRISPVGHPEIRNVHSVAIDPQRPDIIYVGTWHLPWKTVDGGAHWTSIKKGIIDDSDVFSIIIDPKNPRTLYLSACSGIYRTDSSGEQWRKIQGIPYSSRRTRVMAMDPRDSSTVYAGTTEGLWRTRNGGASWTRLTNPTWIINDIVIGSKNPTHVYLGMDHSGVVESRDDGASFQAANQGFAQRQVSSVIADPAHQGRFYAALMGDGQFGSVLVTDDNGANWRNTAPGLENRDVLSLLVLTEPKWKLLAATPEGIYEYSQEQASWRMSNVQLGASAKGVAPKHTSVWELYQRSSGDTIYAASSAGLLASKDGITWTRLPLNVSGSGISTVAAGGDDGKVIITAGSAGLSISRDGGQSWGALHVDGDSHFFGHKVTSDHARPNVFYVAGSTGLYRSTDAGRTWKKFGHGLPYSIVREVMVSPNNPSHVLVASSAGIFESTDGGAYYTRIDVSPAMENLPIQLLAAHPLSSLPILAGSSHNGLFQYNGKEPAQPSLASAADKQPDTNP
ncbi:MAG: transcriptional regulator [Acidobacteria bacterium]|nr:transcriptional regulator [Acidobacteriota bacterium]